LVDNITNFIKEFKEFRKLTPINIFVHGPPFSGKSLYAKRLAEKYELHYISSDKCIRDFVAELVRLFFSDFWR
jgi:adenylate kinase